MQIGCHLPTQGAVATREALASDPAFQTEYMVIGTTSGGMSFGEAFYRGQVADTRSPDRARWLANAASGLSIQWIRSGFDTVRRLSRRAT